MYGFIVFSANKYAFIITIDPPSKDNSEFTLEGVMAEMVSIDPFEYSYINKPWRLSPRLEALEIQIQIFKKFCAILNNAERLGDDDLAEAITIYTKFIRWVDHSWPPKNE